MLIQSIMKRIRSQDAEPFSTDIYGQEEFHSTLAKERARSDRNGHGFSVASFRLNKDTTTLLPLMRTLKNQIRTADEIGWYDVGAIGVLLYNTPAQGAWEFVDTVRAKIDEEKIPHACSVFTCPENWEEQEGPGTPHDPPETRGRDTRLQQSE